MKKELLLNIVAAWKIAFQGSAPYCRELASQLGPNPANWRQAWRRTEGPKGAIRFKLGRAFGFTKISLPVLLRGVPVGMFSILGLILIGLLLFTQAAFAASDASPERGMLSLPLPMGGSINEKNVAKVDSLENAALLYAARPSPETASQWVKAMAGVMWTVPGGCRFTSLNLGAEAFCSNSSQSLKITGLHEAGLQKISLEVVSHVMAQEHGR